jgi:8-oxo-dGTP pyrophosphatase MutT (NUDIX family)
MEKKSDTTASESTEGNNPWTLIQSSVAYENPWIRVDHQDVLTPKGTPGIYGKVHYKNLAIGIIPIDENLNTWIVGQYRYPLDHYSWEIPEGGGLIQNDPEESAQRELKEECGLITQNLEMILEMHLSNSVSDEKALIYLATGLTEVESEPEDTEELLVKKIPFEQLYQMVLRNEITDSMSVAGVLRAKLWLDENGL